MSAFAMTGAAAPAKIAAKYNLGRNSKALNAKGEYSTSGTRGSDGAESRKTPEYICIPRVGPLDRPNGALTAPSPPFPDASQPPFARRAPRP